VAGVDLGGGSLASGVVAPLARELRHERRPKGAVAAPLASSRAQTPRLDFALAVEVDLVCSSPASDDAALAFEERDERRPPEKREDT